MIQFHEEQDDYSSAWMSLVLQVDHERKLMGLIELFMRDDVRANTIVDYVAVFFRLVLLKMREQGQDFDNVQQLCKALPDDDVSKVF
nr:hypothetical protein BaRGS_007570 [Batillaria attramentaria]